MVILEFLNGNYIKERCKSNFCIDPFDQRGWFLFIEAPEVTSLKSDARLYVILEVPSGKSPPCEPGPVGFFGLDGTVFLVDFRKEVSEV